MRSGLRQFLLRGLGKVGDDWSRIAHKLLKLQKATKPI